MPQHASAKKRMRTNERDRQRNRAVKSQVRGATKQVRQSLGDEEAPAILRNAHSVLDNASRKGVLHPRRADRIKSRLAKAVRKATSA